MAFTVKYDPKATGDRTFRGRANMGGHHAAFVDVFGDDISGYDNNGSDTSDASGEIFVDLSANLDDITSATGQIFGSANMMSWDPSLTDQTLEHGSVSGGPFTAGETITGGTSGATAVVQFPGSDFIQTGVITGTFEVGEVITGGSSSATATLTHPTQAAAADASIDKRRVLVLIVRAIATGAIAGSVAVTFTYEVSGEKVLAT